MSKPIVAIVGRPNVGKSMLFNKLIGQRLSIVEDTPGVTRDRIYGECEWCGRKFTLVDTGGIEPRTDSQILTFMREQAQIAIENATVIIFLTDIKTGLTASDQEVANMLLRSRKPIVLAVNKMDSVGAPNPDYYEFYRGGGGGERCAQGRHHRQAERRQILAHKPHSWAGARHRLQRRGHDARRHRLLL